MHVCMYVKGGNSGITVPLNRPVCVYTCIGGCDVKVIVYIVVVLVGLLLIDISLSWFSMLRLRSFVHVVVV